MTKSIRKSQKRLRRQDKPHSPHAQSPNYWTKEMRRRDIEKEFDEMWKESFQKD
jgi:hypothetical protein